MRVSWPRALAAALLGAAPLVTAPPGRAAGAADSPRGPPRAWLSGKASAQMSYRPLFGIPIYGGGPGAQLGARVASGRVGLYGAATAFVGRTAAGLGTGGLTLGFEVTIFEPGFAYGFGSHLGTMSIERASTDGSLSAVVLTEHAGLAVDLLRRRRGPTPYLEGRATLELWLGLDAHDETTGTVAPAVALGVRF